MEKGKYQISLPEGTRELVIREGEALEVQPPRQVQVEGTIDAPLRYLKNRIAILIETSMVVESHLTVDKERGTILLTINENSPYWDGITGKICEHPDITEFQLINEKYRSPEETAVFLRLRKHLFANQSEYMDVFTALRTFTAKVNQEIAAIKDDSGNFEAKKKQVVEHNIPKGFKINVPLFKGVDPVVIEVEFLVDRNLNVAMLSTDLMQKLDEFRAKAVEDVVKEIEMVAPDLLIMYV